MIEVRDLTRVFGANRAVDGISFELERGEVVGLLGPNGAGKSTTMRMLTGFLPPTAGLVRVAGHDVFRESIEVRRKIGYLAEAVPLYREHRVAEMLAFQARLHGMPRREIARRSAVVLERVGLADRNRSLIGNLSKGQRQRVGIAVAMLPDPEVLILDEPTSGLDPLQRIEIRGLIAELAEERTVLLSSHILPEVEAVCPRVIVMHRGKIAVDGRQDELVRKLGHSAAHVEAALPDAQEAATLLESLPGVERVEVGERVGIYHAFDVHASGDVREDIGALAMQRGWALRALSWEEPSLERLFASIALDLEEDPLPSNSGVEEGSASASADRSLPVADGPLQGEVAPASTAGERAELRPGEKAAPKVLFNLNPFDDGGARELGRPKEVDTPASTQADGLLSLDLGPASGGPLDGAREKARDEAEEETS